MYSFQHEGCKLRPARIKYQPMKATRRFQQRKFVDCSVKLKKLMRTENSGFFQTTPSPSYLCTFKTVDSIIDPPLHSKSRILSYYSRIETDPTLSSVYKTKSKKVEFPLKLLLINKRDKQKYKAPLKSHTKPQIDIGCQIDLEFYESSY